MLYKKIWKTHKNSKQNQIRVLCCVTKHNGFKIKSMKPVNFKCQPTVETQLQSELDKPKNVTFNVYEEIFPDHQQDELKGELCLSVLNRLSNFSSLTLSRNLSYVFTGSKAEPPNLQWVISESGPIHLSNSNQKPICFSLDL